MIAISEEDLSRGIIEAASLRLGSDEIRMPSVARIDNFANFSNARDAFDPELQLAPENMIRSITVGLYSRRSILSRVHSDLCPFWSSPE